MNNLITKGIFQELEFETEITMGKEEYKIESRLVDNEQLEMNITDPSDLYHTASVLVSMGKIGGEITVGLKASYKKKVWVERFPSWGTLIDNIPSAISFLKDVAKAIIREM